MSDKNNENIKAKTFNGVIWNYVNKFGLQLLHLLPTMVLTRLLTAEEFGVVAVAAIFTSFVAIFVSSGFSMAIIQKKELTHIDICSVFYFNIVISIVMYILVYAASPFIATFFSMPEVCEILRVSGLALIIGAIGAVQGTLFSKELNFKSITIRNLLSYLVASVVAIILALQGYGYWALVVQGLISAFMTSACNWALSSWRPSLSFSFTSLKTMFGFGSKLLLKNISDLFFGKIYDFVIGKISAADLAYFNRAYSTSNLFTDTFLMVLNSVAFPAFSKMQSNFERLRKNIIRFFLIEMMIIPFIMILAIALAKPIIHILYSSRWDAVIPLFQVLCIWGIFRPISCIFANGLMAYGASGACLKNSFIGRGLNIMLLIFTWKHGLLIMITGQLIAYILEIILYAHSFKKIFKYGYMDLIRDVSPYIAIATVIGAILYATNQYILAPSLSFIHSELLVASIQLAICLLLSLIIFIFAYKKLKLSAFVDFIGIIYDVLGKYPKLQKFIRMITN